MSHNITESIHTRANNKLTLTDWHNRWNTNDIDFHQSEVLPDLLKHEHVFDESCRVFLPLCGKSLDLVYLADKGLDVYGCEFVPKAIQDFFKEQNLEYTTSVLPCGKFTIYKSISKQITLYQGNFFDLNSQEIGKFDAIWDRSSLVAINPSLRMKYVKIMCDIMASKCRYLLNSHKIEGRNYHGPPHSVPIDVVQKLFGSFCKIQFLDSKGISNSGVPNATSIFGINILISK